MSDLGPLWPSCCYLLLEKSKPLKIIFTIMLYDGQLQMSLGFFSLWHVKNVYKQLNNTFSISCELSQPMCKTEFSSTAKNRTNSGLTDKKIQSTSIALNSRGHAHLLTLAKGHLAPRL